MSSFWGFHYFELRLRLKMLMLFLNEHNWHSTKSVFLFVPLYFRFYFMLCFCILCCFLLSKLYLILRWKTLFEKCLPKMKCVTNLITFPSSKWQRMTVETWWQLIFIFVSFRFLHLGKSFLQFMVHSHAKKFLVVFHFRFCS